DAYGNLATGYRGTVRVTSSDAQAVLPADYTFTAADAGRHTFTTTLKTAGSQSLTATDTAAGFSATQTGLQVIPAQFSGFTMSGLPTSVTVGEEHSFTLTA